MVHQNLAIDHVMQISSIFNKTDASIKRLSNIYITANGYSIDGTMIGYDMLERIMYCDISYIYQNDGKLYCRYVDINHYTDGSSESGNRSCHANIIYI